MQRIVKMASENPHRKMWDSFVYFENEPTAKSFLQEHYRNLGLEEAHKYAFQNTFKFIYFLKQAKEYYKAANTSSILVQPLLLYYGMVNLVKTLLTIHDPWYPSHTRLLRHGITTRKLKKANYSFHEDEIKVQKEGLFPLLHELTSGSKDIQEKYQIKELLSMIPELRDSYNRLYKEEKLVPLHISNHVNYASPVTSLYLPEYVLDRFHLTYPSFLSYLNRHNTGHAQFSENPITTPQGIIRIDWHHPEQIHVSESPNGLENELFLQDYKGNFYFSLQNGPLTAVPEECIHFMIMYVLGMLCRYETELWGDILFSFTSSDMFIINEFLHLSERKFPNLILNLLTNERLIFDTM